MTLPRNFTPYILVTFFAVMLLALVGAHAWSHEQAAEAAQLDATNTTNTYVPADDEPPVTDAVIEKVAA